MEATTEINNTIDLHNVLEYYGDINMNILEEVLHIYPNTTKFTFEGREYGVKQEDLYKIMTYWNRILR